MRGDPVQGAQGSPESVNGSENTAQAPAPVAWTENSGQRSGVRGPRRIGRREDRRPQPDSLRARPFTQGVLDLREPAGHPPGEAPPLPGLLRRVSRFAASHRRVQFRAHRFRQRMPRRLSEHGFRDRTQVDVGAPGDFAQHVEGSGLRNAVNREENTDGRVDRRGGVDRRRVPNASGSLPVFPGRGGLTGALARGPCQSRRRTVASSLGWWPP